MNKKKLLFIFILIQLLLIACSNTEGKGEVNQTVIVPQEDEDGLVKETMKDSSPSPMVSYEVSQVETVVHYEGESYRRSVYCTGGEMIYLCGINIENDSFFLAGMKKEETAFRKFAVEIPEGVRVLNMAVDNQNRCHVLMISSIKIEDEHGIRDRITYENSSILVINKDGNLEMEVDASEVFAEKRRSPTQFVIDNEGYYYYDNYDEIVKLSPDGSMEKTFNCKGDMSALGCGKSGTIYCIYMDSKGEHLGRIEGDEVLDCEMTLPNFYARYGVMAAGTDTELLIYNMMGGVFAYQSDINTLEQRLTSEAMPASGEEARSAGFLADGRLCLMIDPDESLNYDFYYIPIGK